MMIIEKNISLKSERITLQSWSNSGRNVYSFNYKVYANCFRKIKRNRYRFYREKLGCNSVYYRLARFYIRLLEKKKENVKKKKKWEFSPS